MKVDGEMVATRDVMPELRQQETFAIAPGATEQLALVESDQATKRWQVDAKVVSPDGRTNYFSHDTEWTASGPFSWKTVVVDVEPLDFLFACHPSLNEVEVKPDVSNLPDDARLETLKAIVRPKDKSDEVLGSVEFDDWSGGQEKAITLPELDPAARGVIWDLSVRQKACDKKHVP